MQHSIIEQSISERLSKDSRRSQSVIGNEILVRTLNMDEWAATRMESLLWEEKLDRIKVFSLVPSNGLDSIAENTLIHTLETVCYGGVCRVAKAADCKSVT